MVYFVHIIYYAVHKLVIYLFDIILLDWSPNVVSYKTTLPMLNLKQETQARKEHLSVLQLIMLVCNEGIKGIFTYPGIYMAAIATPTVQTFIRNNKNNPCHLADDTIDRKHADQEIVKVLQFVDEGELHVTVSGLGSSGDSGWIWLKITTTCSTYRNECF